MPHQHAARPQHPGELPDDPRVILRVAEEAERREQVEHGVEPPGPARGQRAHVGRGVAEGPAGAALPGEGQQRARIVHAVHVEARLGQQVRVPSLAARAIEDTGADRELQHIEQPRDLAPVPRQVEDRLVLQEIALIEVRLPPIGRQFSAPGLRPG